MCFVLQDALRTIYNHLINSFADCLRFLGHNLSGLGDLNLFRAARCSFDLSLCWTLQGIHRPPGRYFRAIGDARATLERGYLRGSFNKHSRNFYVHFVGWFFKKGLPPLSSTWHHASRQRAPLLLPMEGRQSCTNWSGRFPSYCLKWLCMHLF